MGRPTEFIESIFRNKKRPVPVMEEEPVVIKEDYHYVLTMGKYNSMGIGEEVVYKSGRSKIYLEDEMLRRYKADLRKTPGDYTYTYNIYRVPGRVGTDLTEAVFVEGREIKGG